MNGTRTYFFYADEGLVAEYDAEGNELRSYGWQPESTWTTDPLWLKCKDGSATRLYWYQNDHLGTPQKLVDSTGEVVWSASYTAFGEAQIDIETVTNNLRFPGQYWDAETGLHYNWNRYYDPDTGRYPQADPIGFDGGDVNLYAYVWNNSVNWVDSNGLEIIPGAYQSEEDLQAIQQALALIAQCAPIAGKKLLEELQKKDGFVVEIFVTYPSVNDPYKDVMEHTPRPLGKRSEIDWYPKSTCREGLSPCPPEARRPSVIALAHELVHALDNKQGSQFEDKVRDENRARGTCDFREEEISENTIIDEFNINCPELIPQGNDRIEQRPGIGCEDK